MTGHRHRCKKCGRSFSCYGRVERIGDYVTELVCEDFHKEQHNECPECRGVEPDDDE